MRVTMAILALAALLSASAQFDNNEDHRQRVKRGVFLRAGILGAAGLVATQSAKPTHRSAGWAMFAGSTASIFTVQVMIGDRVKEDPRRKRTYFVKRY